MLQKTNKKTQGLGVVKLLLRKWCRTLLAHRPLPLLVRWNYWMVVNVTVNNYKEGTGFLSKPCLQSQSTSLPCKDALQKCKDPLQKCKDPPQKNAKILHKKMQRCLINHWLRCTVVPRWPWFLFTVWKWKHNRLLRFNANHWFMELLSLGIDLFLEDINRSHPSFKMEPTHMSVWWLLANHTKKICALRHYCAWMLPKLFILVYLVFKISILQCTTTASTILRACITVDQLLFHGSNQAL